MNIELQKIVSEIVQKHNISGLMNFLRMLEDEESYVLNEYYRVTGLLEDTLKAIDSTKLNLEKISSEYERQIELWGRSKNNIDKVETSYDSLVKYNSQLEENAIPNKTEPYNTLKGINTKIKDIDTKIMEKSMEISGFQLQEILCLKKDIKLLNTRKQSLIEMLDFLIESIVEGNDLLHEKLFKK